MSELQHAHDNSQQALTNNNSNSLTSSQAFTLTTLPTNSSNGDYRTTTTAYLNNIQEVDMRSHLILHRNEQQLLYL